MTDDQKEQLRKRVLGWGVACPTIDPSVDIARDVQFVIGPNGLLDLAQVSTVDNLGQALSIALTTALGSDIFNVKFGFDGVNAMAEETNPIMMRERIRISVINVLNRDARVRKIVDVKVEDGRLDPVTAGSRILDVRVAFETLSGDQYTINLGQLALNSA